ERSEASAINRATGAAARCGVRGALALRVALGPESLGTHAPTRYGVLLHGAPPAALPGRRRPSPLVHPGCARPPRRAVGAVPAGGPARAGAWGRAAPADDPTRRGDGGGRARPRAGAARP